MIDVLLILSDKEHDILKRALFSYIDPRLDSYADVEKLIAKVLMPRTVDALSLEGEEAKHDNDVARQDSRRQEEKRRASGSVAAGIDIAGQEAVTSSFYDRFVGFILNL